MLVAAACPLLLYSQGSQPVSVSPTARVVLMAGETVPVKVKFHLAAGYHTNSHTPSDEYLIPLRLSWEAAPLVVAGIDYPKPQMEKYAFADKPLSVYSDSFEVTTRLLANASVPKGPRVLKGKLRYQACTNTMCLTPKTVAVEVPIEVR